MVSLFINTILFGLWCFLFGLFFISSFLTMTTYEKRKSFVSVALSVLLSMLFVYVGVSASTTISTDIVTDGDTTIGSGARVGTGSTGTHLTALADDSLLVEGQIEVDGRAWFDGVLHASSTLSVTGASEFVGNVGIASNTPGTVLGVQGRVVSLDLFTGNIIATGTAEVRGNTLLGIDNNSGTLGVATSTVGTGVTLGVNGRVVSLNLFTGNIIATGTTEVRTGIAVATSTSNGQELDITGDAAFMSTATTTIKLGSSDETSGASSGGCIQLDATNGVAHRIYIEASSTAVTDARYLRVEPGECQR